MSIQYIHTYIFQHIWFDMKVIECCLINTKWDALDMHLLRNIWS